MPVYQVDENALPIQNVTIEQALHPNFNRNGGPFRTVLNGASKQLDTHQTGTLEPIFGETVLRCSGMMTCGFIVYFFRRIKRGIVHPDFTHVWGKHVNAGSLGMAENPQNFNTHHVANQHILALFAVGPSSRDQFMAEHNQLTAWGILPANILIYNATSNGAFCVDYFGQLLGM